MVPIVVLAAISVATYVPLCPPRWSRAARLVVTPRGGSPFAAAGAEDPYEVLGVSRDATPAQIKQAYRRLALRSHPDVNKAPDAQATFARIADAYAVLSDAKNKAKYDRSSSYSSSSRGSARRSSSSSGGSSAWSGFDPTDPVGWATGKGRDPAAAAAAEERRRRWREENPTPEELGDSFGALFSDVVSAVGNAVAGSGDWLSLLDELQLSEGPEFQSMLRSRDLTMLREELESSKWVQSTLDSRIRRLTAEVQGAQEDLESFRRDSVASGVTTTARSLERELERDVRRRRDRLADARRLLTQARSREQRITARIEEVERTPSQGTSSQRRRGGPRALPSVDEELERMKREMGR